jgi:aspartyl-tRNA(Asn)/glutamyl-tRNA(Gln) amidotransferase subunit C
MKLPIEQVRQVARLARLALSPEEEERYARQLGDVLAYAESLRELDTTQIAPTAHAVAVPNLTRDDLVLESLPAEVAVRGAPEHLESFVAVPKIIE